jgi:hypothetical protein
MLYADFETRQQLAREHRDELERAMRLARRPRPEKASPVGARRTLDRAGYLVRFLKVKSSKPQLPQEV